MSILSTPLKVGNLEFRNRVFLAPMSGVSDLPFRQRSWLAGAGMVVSEMVASAELCSGAVESQMRVNGKGLPQHVVQLAGRAPEWMARAAEIVQDNHADMIDINMGCPAKKVIGGYSGAALMRDLKLAMSLIEAVLKVARIPVSLKMRLGWDETTINAPELAQMAEAAGIAMITVHGRTRMQFYNGQADWDALKKVRDVISIPMVANGDIGNLEEAEECLRRSGADAVMIGRASYGAPWLSGEIAGHPFSANLGDYVCDHYQAMLDYYGENTGLRHARKHIDWYLNKHAKGVYSNEERQELMTSRSPERVLTLINSIFSRDSVHPKRAA
ncbi:tRNA dihydrouridine synthase DusB [Bartonella choladocola]|uniref:tRNA-dihydrouridine synthase n=1 Tax=Bartonella choladocola TaxID=2750995 RepID=A0A1U9MFQ7_9HYPH|nr:tRNA dihydrouridine synthase DusB [Bartonella choladocola]AQT46539.1 putative TIM-barrel protein, nifR3 family [Bartonella choladocola]